MSYVWFLVVSVCLTYLVLLVSCFLSVVVVAVEEGKGSVSKPSYLDKGLDRMLLKHNKLHGLVNGEKEEKEKDRHGNGSSSSSGNNNSSSSNSNGRNNNNEDKAKAVGGQGVSGKAAAKTPTREGVKGVVSTPSNNHNNQLNPPPTDESGQRERDHVLRKQPKKVVFDAWHVAAGRFILAGMYCYHYFHVCRCRCLLNQSTMFVWLIRNYHLLQIHRLNPSPHPSLTYPPNPHLPTINPPP